MSTFAELEKHAEEIRTVPKHNEPATQAGQLAARRRFIHGVRRR